MVQTAALSAFLISKVKRFFRIQNFQKVAHIPWIEADGDLRAVIGHGQLHTRLADVGGPAGKFEHAAGEFEIDAAALVAGNDGRLANGRMKIADPQLDLGSVVALREHISPPREAAFG